VAAISLAGNGYVQHSYWAPSTLTTGTVPINPVNTTTAMVWPVVNSGSPGVGSAGNNLASDAEHHNALLTLSSATEVSGTRGLGTYGATFEFEVVDWREMIPIYYSVGTDNLALYSGNASATSGALTLSSPAVDKIGVGDEVRVGSNRYYITGRNSSTMFTIQNSGANGGTPGDTNITFGSQSIAIHRAFNSLTAAVTGSSDANHLKTADLYGGSFQLNWPCYNDGPMDDAVTIDGYTTSAIATSESTRLSCLTRWGHLNGTAAKRGQDFACKRPLIATRSSSGTTT